MSYPYTDYFIGIVKGISDDLLDTWIARAEASVKRLKELAETVERSPEASIHRTVEMSEAELAMFKEEKERRLAQKG